MEQLSYSIEQFRSVLSEAWDKSLTIGEGYHLPVIYQIDGENLSLTMAEPILNTKIADNEVYCFHCLMHQEKIEPGHTKEDVIKKAADEIIVHLHEWNLIPIEKRVYRY